MNSLTSNLPATRFPQTLQTILKTETDPALRWVKISQALSHRTTLIDAYFWTLEKKHLTNSHEDLRRFQALILDKAKTLNIPIEQNTLSSRLSSYLEGSGVLRATQTARSQEEIIADQIELFACGIISLKMFIPCLKKPQGTFDPKLFLVAAPMLRKLDPDQIVALFLHHDLQQGSLLHYHEIAPGLKPLLEILNGTQLYKLLSLPYNHISHPENHWIPIHDPSILAAVAPLFSKFHGAQSKALLGMQDPHGDTPLAFVEGGDYLVSLLQDIDSEDIVEILLKSNKDLYTPLHYPAVLDQFLPVFKRTTKPFSSKQILRLFSIRDKDGYVPPHDSKVFEKVKTLLSTSPSRGPLSPEDFRELLLHCDNKGNTVLQTGLLSGSLTFEDIEPILSNYAELGELGFDQIKCLLSLETERGQMLLQAPKAPKNLLPLLERIVGMERGRKFVLDLLHLRDNAGRTLLHHGLALKLYWPLLKKHYTHDEIKSLLLVSDFQGINVLRAAYTSTPPDNVLADFFTIDFTFTPQIRTPILSQSPLKLAVRQWVNAAPTGEGISPLQLPLILGYMDIVLEGLEKLSSAERETFFRQIPERAAEIEMNFLLKDYILDESHLHRGQKLSEKVPTALRMDGARFGHRAHTYPHFHSFLPDFIENAEAQGWLDEPTKAGLLNMEKNIRNNVKLDKMADDEGARKKQYEEFCAYLTYIIDAYKIDCYDSDNGEEKIKILKELAEAQSLCFTRWMKQAKQRYFARPAKQETANSTPLSLRDCLYALLRTDRIDLLSTKMLHFAHGAVHESNYLLDLFREELGTLLEPINDPFSKYTDYPRTKEQLRKQFDIFYSKVTIVASIVEHLNVQKHRKSESTDLLDLSADEVEFALREWANTSWLVEEYNQAAATAQAMQKQGKSDLEISEYLETFGIDWVMEESVEDAERRLHHIVLQLPKEIAKAKGIFVELSEATTAIALDELMQRHPEITRDKPMSREEFDEAAKAHLNKLRERESLLKGINEQIKTASRQEKKKVLQEHRLIVPGQTLQEVLSTNNLSTVRINRFIEEEVYDANRNFTPKAAIIFLESMDVLQRGRCKKKK